MPGIIADNNIEGHFAVLLRILRSDPWHEIWSGLGLEIASFEDLGLSSDASDSDLWLACQAHEVLLITANRTKTDRIRWKQRLPRGTNPPACRCLPCRMQTRF